MKDSQKEKKVPKEKKKSTIKEKIPMFLISAFAFFFLLTVAGLSIFTYQLLHKSDYFFIKACRIDWLSEPLSREPYEKLCSTGAGENIFAFNIASATEEILAGHTELKSMRIAREFPDRLALKMGPRRPVAQVGEMSFFLVDDEGVILTELRDSISEDLPIISGAGWRLFHKIGQKENSLRMQRALALLESIGESDFLKRHTLTKVDVSDYRNISFFIEDGLEVKIGHSNFKERVGQLDKALDGMAINRDEIKYIDLRFDDVVLGTK